MLDFNIGLNITDIKHTL